MQSRVLRLLNLVALLAAVAWLAQTLEWEPLITSLGLFGTLVFQEVRAGRAEVLSSASPAWPPLFSEVDYVRHVATHAIDPQAIESAFRGATSISNLSVRLKALSPSPITCEWFEPELMGSKYIAQINLARKALRMPPFEEPNWSLLSLNTASSSQVLDARNGNAP